ACAFRDKVEQFAQLDTVVIGISTDALKDQEKFTEKENLNFPLFADNEKNAAKAFGVLGAGGYAQRKTFVIDKKGGVRRIYDKVDVKKHADEVLGYVKETLAK